MALLTPVAKAFFTDYGSEACNLCLQVFGGHGYIAEWGMEQLVRDARIAQIYEGANGIHALDLVGRKLSMHGGRLIARYLELLEQFVAANRDDPELHEFVAPVATARERLVRATEWIREAAAHDADEIGASSYDYLRLMALTAFGHMWALTAKVARTRVDGDNTGFYRTKLATARFYMRRLLPQTVSLSETLSAGADALMAVEAEHF